MKIHIGELIRKKLDECGMDKTVFAQRIKKSYPTALNIFKKPSIKTEDLLRISKVLKYDFFRVYSGELQLTCPEATSNVRPVPAQSASARGKAGDSASVRKAASNADVSGRSSTGSATQNKKDKSGEISATSLPRFRKSVYSQDFIENLLRQINNGTISRYEAIQKYELPKTTLYRWCRKNEFMN